MVNMNKGGLMRIVEASVAILIIFSVLFILFLRSGSIEKEDLTKIISPLLNEVAKDKDLRIAILKDDSLGNGKEDVMAFLSDRIKNPGLRYGVQICDLGELCSIGETYPAEIDTDIYSAERIISTEIGEENYPPKRIKLFIWRKS